MRAPHGSFILEGGVSGRGTRTPPSGRRARAAGRGWCHEVTTRVSARETQMGIGAARGKLEGFRGGDGPPWDHFFSGVDQWVIHVAEPLDSARQTMAPDSKLIMNEFIPFNGEWCTARPALQRASLWPAIHSAHDRSRASLDLAIGSPGATTRV